nr:uncharacterized protein LOC124492300 [Dermatophagoides farinae]
MVDPLIIIALIALPTIGMLGLSSLIMPLIPIGIYVIQQFFPTGAGRRRRRRSLSITKSVPYNHHLFNDELFEWAMRNFLRMMNKQNISSENNATIDQH